jgi:hypothetical protein
MPVHQHALAEAGVYLIENLALDELARDGVGSFCFILLATKFRERHRIACTARCDAMIGRYPTAIDTAE